MNKYLVTGGAGFVGRHLCRALLDQGHHVVCVDSVVPATGGICPTEEGGWPFYDPMEYRNFTYIRQDCRRFFQDVSDTDFDAAFHLAAIVGGRQMIEQNPLAVAEDLSIDSSFWKWCERVRPGKAVCFSSSAAYPIKYQRRGNYRLLTENMVDFSTDLSMPDMSYGWAKLTHEYLAKLAYERHGIKSVTYRPFSGYGEDQDLSYPFPAICQRVLENQGAKTVSVWGSGNQMRDFIHISDCVKGVLCSMDAIDDGSAVNLSTGVFTSFRQFLRIAAGVLGYYPEVLGTRSKPEGVFARGGDTRLQLSLGMVHSVSFEEGIERGLRYMDEARSKNKLISV